MFRSFLHTILAAWMLSVVSGASHAALRAGAAAVDISPKEFPLNLPGGFRANIANTVNDPLHSSAIVFDDGKTALALVVVDNLGLDPEVIAEAKAMAAKTLADTKTPIAVEHMLVASTHTHSAPRSSGRDGSPAGKAYRKQITEGIAESIIKAHAALQPAGVAASSHPLPEEVFNRRWYLKPGKMPPNPFGEMDAVKMNPSRSAGTLDKPAGPTDPDIDIISVQSAKRRPLALFANYALHYVGGVPRGEISADYFGEFARLMPNRLRARDGDGFVAMLSNGASADINNIPFNVTRPPRKAYEQIRIVARKAADTAWFAHRKIETYHNDVTLAMRERTVTLTHRKPSEEMVARARKIIAIKDEAELKKLPRLAEAYARRTIGAYEKPKTLDVTIQALHIGDIAVVGIPFEVFVEIGLEIKKKSPFEKTIVIGLANGRHGYLPTPEQHKLGGYETWLGTNYVQKDASVILTKHLLEMLGEMKK